MEFGKEWGAGVAVGVVFGGVAGWVASTWPGLVVATSAKNWWDIATAIGTLGATGAALYFGLAKRRSESEVRIERLTSALWLVDEAVQSAQWVDNHLTSKAMKEVPVNESMSRNELSAFLASMDAINRIPFHEPHFSEAHRALIHVLGALRSLAPRISECLAIGAGESVRMHISADVFAAKSSLDEALEKAPLKGLPAAGRLYF